MRPSRGRPNHRRAARSSKSHTSAVYTTTTNGAPPDRSSRHRRQLAASVVVQPGRIHTKPSIFLSEEYRGLQVLRSRVGDIDNRPLKVLPVPMEFRVDTAAFQHRMSSSQKRYGAITRCSSQFSLRGLTVLRTAHGRLHYCPTSTIMSRSQRGRNDGVAPITNRKAPRPWRAHPCLEICEAMTRGDRRCDRRRDARVFGAVSAAHGKAEVMMPDIRHDILLNARTVATRRAAVGAGGLTRVEGSR
jgi:hypothetical protein